MRGHHRGCCRIDAGQREGRAAGCGDRSRCRRVAAQRRQLDGDRDERADEEQRAGKIERARLNALLRRIEREQKNLHLPTDKRLLAAFVRRAQARAAG